MIVFLGFKYNAVAQKKVKLQQADSLIGGLEGGERVDRLFGNIIFKQKQTTIYCDRAIFNKKKNTVEAYGNVKIIEGDSVVITSRKLTYDGNDRIAKLRENVVFEKKARATLYTDFLDYYRNQQQARYFNNGKLVDSINVLTSEKGYFNTYSNLASFKGDVVGTNPDYTIASDTMQYNVKTNIVYFLAPTTLTDEEGNVFDYNEGQYNTNQRRSRLQSGIFETETYKISGDKIFLDNFRKSYHAKGNVVMVSKEESVIVEGDIGDFDKISGIAKVYGRPLMKKIMREDTLFLTADTLVSIDSEIEREKRLLAYHNVKIYKTDLRGKSDSLAYIPSDSIIYFYDDPVLWNAGNQITADSINITLSNNQIDKLNMKVKSFVISEDTLRQFNQIKGRNMTAFFEENKIDKVNVDGNGESLYYALDETDTYLVGMNKILCSNMVIRFIENQVDNMSFYVKPDAKFIPPHELEAPEKTLKGFHWRIEEKPDKKDVLIRYFSDAEPGMDIEIPDVRPLKASLEK